MPLDINSILDSGVNEFFHQPIRERLHLLPEDLQEKYLHDVRVMSAVGVGSDDDQKAFFYVLQHTPSILKELAGGDVGPDNTAKVAASVYENREKYPINTVFGFFIAVAKAAEDAGVPIHGTIKNKIAYPQGMGVNEPKPAYDVKKWMQATQDIYLGIAHGKTFEQAKNEITEGWTPMEKTDYKYWLRFYQEKTPEKYKIAQKYYESELPGFFVPNIKPEHLKSGLPSPVIRPEVDMPAGMPAIEKKTDPEEEKREKIEAQRARIISRLNAAEKLLSSLDGQFFAGDDQELMLKLLQDLKRKVQTANKIHVHSSLFIDLIYKTSNFLDSKGHSDGAYFFKKIAQMPALDLGIPPTDQPSMGDQGGDTAKPTGNKEDTKKALEEFFSLLETGVGDVEDTKERKERAKERKEKRRQRRKDNNDVIEVVAQALDEIPIGSAEGDVGTAPTRQPLAPDVAPQVQQPAPTEDLEVTEEPTEDTVDDKVDDTFDAALSNITIQDVIARLETVTTIYKRREMSRQLAEIDIMMDRLGISSYFPSLGEAMAKALESNQYISTRVDDVLAKIKGTVGDEGTIESLTGVDKDLPEETAGLRKSLQEKDEKEKANKEKRRQQQMEKDMQEPVGEQAVEELGGQAPVERAAPVPTRENIPPMPR